MAFQICAVSCFREYFPKTRPALLEPIMKVEVEAPEQFQGAIVGDITSRRGLIVATGARGGGGVMLVQSEVPLAELFGYATDLRSMTQGQGTFTMELLCYRKTPAALQQEIVERRRKKELVGA
jgi:elongation factor G